MSLLLLGGLSGGNDADHGPLPAIAETHQQHPQLQRKPDDEKPILVLRVIGVGRDQGPLVEEYRLRFLERDVMLFLVGTILCLVPFERRPRHVSILATNSRTYNVFIE